jgi:transcription initiation factor TFIIH subunit 2
MLVIRVVCSWIIWAKPYKSIRNIANKNEVLQTSHSPCWLSEKTLRYLRNLSLIHLKIIIKSRSFTAFTKNEGYIVWWGAITSKFIKKGYELKKKTCLLTLVEKFLCYLEAWLLEEVRICREIAKRTGGNYNVLLNDVKELILNQVQPPAAAGSSSFKIP